MSINIRNMGEQERNRAYAEISRQSGDSQYYTRKELNELPRLLSDSELLISFSSGLHDGTTWLLVLTNQRVLFLDKGMFFGLKQISIPLDKINSVSGRTGLFFGQVFIEDGASTYNIENMAKSSVGLFTNKVREAIEARRQGVSSPTSTTQPVAPLPSAEDRITKLERLSTLRDKGVLTPTEFEAEKAKILAT